MLACFRLSGHLGIQSPIVFVPHVRPLLRVLRGKWNKEEEAIYWRVYYFAPVNAWRLSKRSLVTDEFNLFRSSQRFVCPSFLLVESTYLSQNTLTGRIYSAAPPLLITSEGTRIRFAVTSSLLFTIERHMKALQQLLFIYLFFLMLIIWDFIYGLKF